MKIYLYCSKTEFFNNLYCFLSVEIGYDNLRIFAIRNFSEFKKNLYDVALECVILKSKHFKLKTGKIMFFVTGCIILSAGIFMVIKSRKKTKLLEKYEQENRSSDGSIQFDSIQLSRTHGADKNLYRVIIIMGVFTGLFGLIFMGYGLIFFISPA